MLCRVLRHHPPHAIKRDVISKVLQFAIEFALSGKVSVPDTNSKNDDGKDQKEKDKVFKKWKDLRVVLKRYLNRAHALTARLTDPDLAENESDENEQGCAPDDDNSLEHAESVDPIVKAPWCESVSHSRSQSLSFISHQSLVRLSDQCISQQHRA